MQDSMHPVHYTTSSRLIKLYKVLHSRQHNFPASAPIYWNANLVCQFKLGRHRTVPQLLLESEGTVRE